ncbi:MAG: 3-oxoacyl-[acyl-carrier-protein] synthase II [Myxococcota bacterium]|jgi:3-oxoacyl-[acyl-carrier-protein] synthase II
MGGGVSRRVVVTGLGTVNPCGLDVPSTWEALCQARSGTGRLTRFDPTDLACQVAAEVNGFDPVERFGRRDTRRLGRFMQFALAAGDEAMGAAGYDRTGDWPDPERFGIYVGSGIGGFPEICAGADVVSQEGVRRLSPFFIPTSLINLAAGQLAIRLGAQGPSLCVATACAVGNHAIGEAWRVIRDGTADVVLAGGAEAALSPLGFGGFMNMKALTKRNHDPQHASRPFDAERDGFVMGEGAGLVVLESLEHARARRAPIVAELVGYAATTDAHHITAPAPGGAGAARCMALALRIAGLRPEDVDYINAHGTGTPANDPAETTAIRTVFGAHADRLAVSSTKGCTGHLLGAAGGLEAVATAMALRTGIVPPTANLEHPDPACDLDYVSDGARELQPSVAMSNGFGFGGTNAVLVFRRLE